MEEIDSYEEARTEQIQRIEMLIREGRLKDEKIYKLQEKLEQQNVQQTQMVQRLQIAAEKLKEATQ